MSLAGALLLFVASRLLYLVLIDPSYLSPQPYDELYVGTIAQELVTGLSMPFAEYRADEYMLGTLVMGALASGFFLLFGPTLFALKLASLLVLTLALAVWYWTIQRYAGDRVASYFALLFCFSPPLFTAYSVATLGDHADSILFSALTVLLLFKILSEEKPAPAYPLLLGLTAGFGLWFAYIYGLTVLALIGFWLWHDKRMLRRTRFAWFAMGFVVAFSPWISMDLQNHFAGLLAQGATVWGHFGLVHLLDSLAHLQRLAPVEFLTSLASDDSWDLYRQAVNLLYSLLYLGPILTAGVLRLKTGRAAPTGPTLTRPTLVGFSMLYVVIFALAVQFSDFRATRYRLPAYPFLFFFAAHALTYCQDRFPHVQRQIQTLFLASVVVVNIGTHAPLLSLNQPGYALSARGYAYAFMPGAYVFGHAPGHRVDPKIIAQLVQRPILSEILPKLSSDDQRELSRGIMLLLTYAFLFNGQAEDFARIEQLVPPGFARHFYYQMGATAIGRHAGDLPKAVAAVEFVRHRSASAHLLALIGIYRTWPRVVALDRSPEALVTAPAAVAPELSPHYWRAIGHWAGRYWYGKDQSLSFLNAHLQAFVPRLDPSVQRYVLQGVGEFLFDHVINTPRVAPAELERFPHAYQEGLLEGWGMALEEDDLFSGFPWHGQASPYWMASTKGLSARSLVSIEQGKAQFDALFKGPDLSVLDPPRQQVPHRDRKRGAGNAADPIR